MARRLKLKYPAIKEMSGCNSLTLELEATLVRPRAKRNDRVDVTLEFERSAVTCLLKELRKMHDRDLERLARERVRLNTEAGYLARDSS